MVGGGGVCSVNEPFSHQDAKKKEKKRERDEEILYAGGGAHMRGDHTLESNRDGQRQRTVSVPDGP